MGELIASCCIASNKHVINARTGVRRVQPVQTAFEGGVPVN